MTNLSNPFHVGTGLGSLCVGREAELAHLRSLYERAAREGGHCLLVSGPSGVGKSRLLQEFKRRARLDGICVLEGRCRPDGRAYQPFLEVVREASSYLADLAPALFHAARSVEIMEALSGSNAEDGQLRFERWEDRRTSLFASVGELLLTVAHIRSPAVILHDLQLADEDTLALLGHLLDTLSGAKALQAPRDGHRFQGIFLLSERQNGEDRLQTQRLLTGVSHTRLPLESLDRAGVEAFLTAPSVVSRFIEVTGGNPRQIEALIEHSTSDADQLLRERIVCLPEAARAMVEALAVLGRPASPRTLGLTAGIRGPALSAATDRLLRGEILVSSIVEGDLKVAFKSTSDQDAVLSGVSAELRAALHQRAGEEMLRQGDDVSAAEHLLQGTQRAEASEVALRAGERLEIAFAYERAIDLYERALEDAPERLNHEIEERLCDLLELTGEYERAVELTRRLTDRQRTDPRLQRRLGHLLLQQGDFTAAREQLQRGLQMLDTKDACPAERALVLSDLAEVSFLQGDQHGAKARVAEVLEAHHEDALIPALKARNTLGKVHLERGEYAEAAALFRVNLQVSREANIIPEEIRALINQGITHLRQGRLDEAAECYRAGLSASEASRDYRHRAFCLQNLGVLAHWRRDYTSALQLFHDAIQTFLKLGHKSWLSWLALDLGDLYLELGDAVRAETMLELSGDLVDEKDDSQTPLFARVLQAKLAAFGGHLTEAEAHLRVARELALRAEKSDEAATASLELARILLQTGRATEARELAAEWADAPTPKTRAAARTLLGEAALFADADPGEPQQALEDALALYQQVGDANGTWTTLARQALLAQGQGRHRDVEAAIRQAARIEARIRKSVPEEFLESYLQHPQRQPLLAVLGVAAPTPRPATEALPRETKRAGVVSERPGGAELKRSRPARHDKRYPSLHGEHEEILRVLDLVDKIAPIDATVLIRGESGTGKELVAEALHRHSRRADRPFVKVNCGALVESLLLSELFGHERGAFTGASRRKLGRFEVADGGTIFLDEIGDITPKTQVALLRVLQEKEFERVGGNAPIRVNVRIVCATNRDLEQMVQEGSFREDLYYRLKAFQIEVPPLRRRGTDVVLLARRFLENLLAAGECPPRVLSRDAERTLLRWRWPGNVRELQNVIRSVSLLADGDVVQNADLSPFLPEMGLADVAAQVAAVLPDRNAPQEAAPAPPAPAEDAQADPYRELLSEGISLHEYKKKIEEACIARALRETSGNITRAAELLKMKRPRLSQLVKEYGLVSETGKDRMP